MNDVTYKLFKHFFYKTYNTDFDNYFIIKTKNDINTSNDAHMYLKFLQAIFFAESKGDKKVTKSRVRACVNMLLNLKHTCQSQLEKISSRDISNIKSHDANTAVSNHFILSVIDHYIDHYNAMIESSTIVENVVERLFFPPETDIIRGMRENDQYHISLIKQWIMEFNPDDYVIESDLDVEITEYRENKFNSDY